jgi:hypothetical protein
MANINGGHMFVSGLVTYFLAHGMDPVKVARYASLAFMPVFVKLVDVIRVVKFRGIDTGNDQPLHRLAYSKTRMLVLKRYSSVYARVRATMS